MNGGIALNIDNSDLSVKVIHTSTAREYCSSLPFSLRVRSLYLKAYPCSERASFRVHLLIGLSGSSFPIRIPGILLRGKCDGLHSPECSFPSVRCTGNGIRPFSGSGFSFSPIAYSCNSMKNNSPFAPGVNTSWRSSVLILAWFSSVVCPHCPPFK